MITPENIRDRLSFGKRPGHYTLVCGVFVLDLYTDEYRGATGDSRLTVRLFLDAYSEDNPTEGLVIDLLGTEKAVLEQGARILNQWQPEKIREWANGMEELNRPKVRRSALARLVEE